MLSRKQRKQAIKDYIDFIKEDLSNERYDRINECIEHIENHLNKIDD